MHVATLPGYGKVVLAHLEGCNENSFFDFDAPLPVKQSKSINWYGPWPCNLYSTVLSTTVNAIYSFNWFNIYHNNWLYIRIYIYPKHILGEFASIYRRIWWFPKKWHVSVISVGISKIVYNNNIICSVPDSQIIRIYVCIHIRILYLSYIVCHISYIYIYDICSYITFTNSPTLTPNMSQM